jgi:hypothetical protein
VRVLRFLRSASAAAAVDVSNETDGLEAFSSETKLATEADAERRPRGSGQWLTTVLVVAVVLEAVPAALWISSRFQSLARPAVAAPASPVFLASVAGAPPCEPPAMAFADAPVAPVQPPRRAAPVPAVAPQALAGMVAVSAPVPMRVYEEGRLIGTSEAETIMLPVGNHDLEFVNDSVGYRARRSVQVQAGRIASVALEAPMGTVHINAVPWAEVWIDNQRVGETPIGNLRTRIGNHQVVFRHPQLGERRTTVLVTLTAPARISMDLRSK